MWNITVSISKPTECDLDIQTELFQYTDHLGVGFPNKRGSQEIYRYDVIIGIENKGVGGYALGQ